MNKEVTHYEKALHFLGTWMFECGRNTNGILVRFRIAAYMSEEGIEIEFPVIHPTDGSRLIRLFLHREGTWRLIA